MHQSEAFEKLHKLIKGIKFAMLTTVDEKGNLHSRPMATRQSEFDRDLWFFTSDRTHKVSELRRNPHVNVSYADPEQNRYVSVSGTAELVRDREKARELWSPAFRAWFPEGLDDPQLSLLRVTVNKAEYWDSPSAPVVQLIGFVKAMASGQRYEPGENETLDFGRRR